MTTKVKVTREVAEAIERYRNRCATNSTIIRDVVGDFADDVLVDCNMDLLMQALVNGYEIEKTPEDKVREYYVEHTNSYKYLQSYARTVDATMKKTLDLLGIKIGGVNA